MTAYFEQIRQQGHEDVVFCSDTATGLKAIIAIHNTTLGPALGGCRIKTYVSEEEALKDVLLLSEAMTYKSAAAGMALGGGKSVVMIDNPRQKTPELLRAFARRIDSLRGLYIGAGDIGSNTHDLKIMKQFTPWVTGLAQEDGGLGDSSILTALGVFRGIQAAVKFQLGKTDLSGLRIGVQGVGKVGTGVLSHLHQAGCKLWITDTQAAAIENVKAQFPDVEVVSHDELFTMELDVLSPNAIGGIVTPQAVENMKAPILAGGANNILSDETVGQLLLERNILYAPDFVINCGGVIMVGCEFYKKTFEEAREQTEAVYDRITAVFKESKKENIPTDAAAKRLALKRIQAGK